MIQGLFDPMQKYTLDDLLYLMERLRTPETGCPWDQAQTYETLVKYTIEETFEVIDAICTDDMENLCEELGDLLLQIVFYAQIAKEADHFYWEDIIHVLVEKMIRRHPHVFPNGNLKGFIPVNEKPCTEKIKDNWQRIKNQEKNKDLQTKSILSDIPKDLPALQTAYKLQKKAAKVGFDWTTLTPVIEKLKEETEELEQAIETGKHVQIEEELGDLMFSLVNLSRHLSLDPEVALRKSSSKFKQRFQFIEQACRDANLNISEQPLEFLEEKWQSAKDLLKT